MGLDFSLQASQKQQLSHSQLQSLEILSMSQEEIGQLLQNEYLDNPMMECRSNDMFMADPAGLRRGYEQTLSYSHTYEDMIEEEDRRSSDFRSKNPDLLKHYILDQLPYTEYTTQWPLYEFLAGCLDENGYFTEDPALVSRETGYSKQEVDDALRVLRRLEPCGIFAKDLKDCLLCQLSAAGKEGTVVWHVVSDYLDDFGYFGMLIFPLIMGGFFEILYWFAKKNRFGFSWICYALLVYPLLYFTIAEQFFARLHLGIVYEIMWVLIFYYLIYDKNGIWRVRQAGSCEVSG